MVRTLVECLPGFDGQRSRVRCFLHVLSLVAKSLIAQFDGRGSQNKVAKDDAEKALLALEAELEKFEREEAIRNPGEVEGEVEGEGDVGSHEDEEPDADDTDDEVDALEEMSEAERAQFEEDVRPVKLALAKVSIPVLPSSLRHAAHLCVHAQIRTLSFKIINSSTKLLPAWKAVCAEKNLPVRLLPRDVRTRWNSTYDMLNFAIEYHDVVNQMTMRPENGLRAYELTAEAWTVLRQLSKVLKVRQPPDYV